VLDSLQRLESKIIANNSDRNRLINMAYNCNYRNVLNNAGKQITADLDYVSFDSRLSQNFQNEVFDPLGANTFGDKQTGSIPTSIGIFSIKSDLTLPINSVSKLDAGLKSANTITNNDALYLLTIAGITDTNFSLTNRFNYNEWIHAAYVNYNTSYKRLEMQLGLRFERTIALGKQLGNSQQQGSSFNRNFSNLFPTVFLSYKADSIGVHMISLNAGRRIARPFFKDLNPFVSPLDKFTFYAGNPYLLPTFTYSAAIAYTYNNTITITGTATSIRDNIQETIEIKDAIYYQRPNNIGSSVQYNLSIESAKEIKRWWTISGYSELAFNRFASKLYTENLKAQGKYWFINGASSFIINKKISTEINGQFISNFIDAQFAFTNYGFLGLAASMSILKNKGTVRLNISDVLHSNRIKGTINFLQLTDAGWRSVNDTRVASLTFSYRFGKATNSKPKYNSKGADTETQRVKG
jgi:hypothetical protein